jgi:hypothetical protein
MGDDYRPTWWHVLACVFFATLAAVMPGSILHGWQPVIVGAIFTLALLILFLLVHSTVTGNIYQLRLSAKDLLDSVRDVDDSRLRTIGVHFPEWRIKPLEEGEAVAFLLEDTSITREFLIKILTHSETDNIKIAPVRSFPQRRGQQLMAAEFHRLAHARGWAEEWGGSATSKWRPGWSALRVLNLYGCGDALHLQDLNQLESLFEVSDAV